MHGARKTSITLLTNKCQIDNKNGNEVIEGRKEDKKKENTESRYMFLMIVNLSLFIGKLT